MYCKVFEVLQTRNIHEIVGIEMRELHFKYDRVLQCCNLWKGLVYWRHSAAEINKKLAEGKDIVPWAEDNSTICCLTTQDCREYDQTWSKSI